MTRVQQDVRAGLLKQGIRNRSPKTSLVIYMMTLNDTEHEDMTNFRRSGGACSGPGLSSPTETLFVGDILKITHTAKGYSFYAKVSDLVHESNFADENWDTRPFSEHFYDWRRCVH